MKKWICKVCGYEHIGEAPPDVCPVCGVGPEEFEPAPEAGDAAGGPAAPAAGKRWKCTVCDYIHVGETPPDVCPVCGVGPEEFVQLADATAGLTAQTVAVADEATAHAALDKISYGLYVVSSRLEGRVNGQCANSVMQLTSKPPRIGVCLNKNNLTHEFVTASGVLAVSILKEGDLPMVRQFGFRSGREKDKFAEVEYLPGRNGCPVLPGCVAFIEARVVPAMTVDVGTHTLFVADVTGGALAEEGEAMTYANYRRAKRGG